MVQNFIDSRRACRDRHHHVLEAFLDPLGNFDLTFTSQQLNRAHFTHIHAHRISCSTKIRVNCRQRRFGLVLDVIIRGRDRRIFTEQQRFSIGSLIVDRDTHIAKRADNAINGLSIHQIIRQMVVDLAVG